MLLFELTSNKSFVTDPRDLIRFSHWINIHAVFRQRLFHAILESVPEERARTNENHFAWLRELAAEFMQPIFDLARVFQFAFRHQVSIGRAYATVSVETATCFPEPQRCSYFRSGINPKCNTSQIGKAKRPITMSRSHVHWRACACIGKIVIMK